MMLRVSSSVRMWGEAETESRPSVFFSLSIFDPSRQLERLMSALALRMACTSCSRPGQL